MEEVEPQPNSQKNQSEREQSAKEHGFRANVRNSYRNIWQIIFGRGKTTAMDIAEEEAWEMNREIEERVKEGKNT